VGPGRRWETPGRTAPLTGGDAAPFRAGDPEACGCFGREAGATEEREGKGEREMLFSSAGWGEFLGGGKAQESKEFRPGLILRGAQRGLRFFGGRKSLEHRGEAVGFLFEVHEGRRPGKPGFDRREG